MADPLTQSVSWSVIDGISLFVRPLKRLLSRSGLSVAFMSGRVGAIGLDFVTAHKRERYDQYIDWQFALKIVNPTNEYIALERISASWRSWRNGFYASTSKYNTGFIKPIFPGPTLPDHGDESLPRSIAPGATELLEVTTLLEFYRQTHHFLPKKKKSSYTHVEYGDVFDDLSFEVTIHTNKGRTQLKSS